tara:strand:+ start:9542 stop:10075 length:534 start_codon:yes stop_codon:yes gene_type:complete
MQSFTTQFNLTREYLAETYDQSLPHGKSASPNYWFPAVTFGAGAGLLFLADQPAMAGIILLSMAALELLHIRFRRAWWLARQMFGRGADSDVILTIDEDGIQTQNPTTKTALLWVDVERVIETELGLILVARSGVQQYLSKSLFSTELVQEIVAKTLTLTTTSTTPSTTTSTTTSTK